MVTIRTFIRKQVIFSSTKYETFQELNAVYNINKDQELKSHQSHLLHNIRNVTEQSYNQSFIESYGGQLYPEPLHQLDTHHLSHHLSPSHQVRMVHRPNRAVENYWQDFSQLKTENYWKWLWLTFTRVEKFRNFNREMKNKVYSFRHIVILSNKAEEEQCSVFCDNYYVIRRNSDVILPTFRKDRGPA